MTDIIVNQTSGMPDVKGPTKALFLVTVRIPLECRLTYFLTNQINKAESYVTFLGSRYVYPLDDLKSIPFVLETLEKGPIQELTYPWNRVVEIRSLTYKRKESNSNK